MKSPGQNVGAIETVGILKTETKNDLQNYVEPSLLSQVCDYIEKKRIEKENRLLHENTNLNIENQILETEIVKHKDEKKKLIAKNKIKD